MQLAPAPDAIEVPSWLNASLVKLSQRLDGRLALVSGRSLADLQSHLGDLTVAQAGSHGIDRVAADGGPLGDAPALISPAIREEVADFAAREGFDTENKPHGAALHCRARPELEQQGLEFARALAERNGLVVKRGKYVIELVAPGADKGGAVSAFMDQRPFAGSRPFFLGDDVTDEDGFRAVEQSGGAGILIGHREESRARFALADPAGVYEWLEL